MSLMRYDVGDLKYVSSTFRCHKSPSQWTQNASDIAIVSSCVKSLLANLNNQPSSSMPKSNIWNYGSNTWFPTGLEILLCSMVFICGSDEKNLRQTMVSPCEWNTLH